ncbi:hypothetical protein CEXT_133801 [Caerostris extrusa]|uniref:Uncharacterized protein n=1 Tax=Caerostris extrusa TaxID=172846 RepID=A0AAV4V6S1_CAEEX|nr:hypothetical protein CEXT_133801 [Caerostris extrusa]
MAGPDGGHYRPQIPAIVICQRGRRFGKGSECNPTAGIAKSDGLYKWVLMGEKEKCRAGFTDKRGNEPGTLLQ